MHRNPWTCPRNNNGSRNSHDKVRRWDSRLWPTSLTSTWMLEGIPPHPQRRCSGRGRTRWRGLRGEPAGQPSVAAGPSQVRHVPSTARAASIHPQGRLSDRDPAAGDSDLRGQGAPAGGRHGAGSRSTNRTSRTARTASGPDDRRIKRWRVSGNRRWPWEEAGSWMWTFVSFSIRLTTATSVTFSSVGYGMECCYD